MGSRGCLALAVAFLAGVVAAIAPSAESGPPPLAVGRTVYVVAPDPRLCPSPLCGGYWVSRANHARTRCHDGLLRPRCYVAAVVDSSRRQQLRTSLPAGSLARGVVSPWQADGFDDLGALIVNELWKPVTEQAATGTYYRLRDRHVRCVRAPCFSITAWRVNRGYRTTISDVDLRTVPVQTRARIEVALTSKWGLLAQGRIARSSDGGRVFRAARVFLESER